MRCARFQGINKVDFIDQYDCPGTILEAVRDIPNFIKRNTRLAAQINQMRRKDIPEYALIAIREVLIRSAMKLSAADLKALNTTLAAQFKQSVEITVVEEAALIGGLIIESGDYVKDGSLRGQLNQLKHTLTTL